MKKSLPLFLSFAFVGSMALMSHHNGVAEEQGKDRTGAPGSDQDCTYCHQAGAAVPTSSVAVYDSEGVEVSEYIPGQVYDVEFVVESDWAVGYGFQGTAVMAGGANAGEFSSPGTNVQLENVGSRHIVEHSDVHASGVFNVVWTAPEQGTGEVAFFNAGLAVNGAYGNSGDAYHGTAHSIGEGIDDSVNEGAVLIEAAVPFVTGGEINWTAHRRGNISVYALNGQIVESVNVNALDLVRVGVDAGKRAIYIVQFTSENGETQSWKIAA